MSVRPFVVLDSGLYYVGHTGAKFMDINRRRDWEGFLTRALPLSRGSSQWGGVTVTRAQTRWDKTSVQPFLLAIHPQFPIARFPIT